MSNTLTEATLPLFETLQRKAPFNLQHKAIPIKCFVSDRPTTREGGSVGPAKKKKKKKKKRMNT